MCPSPDFGRLLHQPQSGKTTRGIRTSRKELAVDEHPCLLCPSGLAGAPYVEDQLCQGRREK